MCGLCGQKKKIVAKGLCMNCYQHMRRADGYHIPSEYGDISYSNKGYPICHICGVAMRQLGSHIYQKHGMTTKNYKLLFGLVSKGLLEKELAALKSQQVQPQCIAENLLEKGKPHRYCKNDIRIINRVIPEQEMRMRRRGKAHDIHSN